MTTSNTSPAYHAFHVKDGFFTKIGAAWKSKGGNALNIRLDLLPPDGRFTLVEPKSGTPSGDSPEA